MLANITAAATVAIMADTMADLFDLIERAVTDARLMKSAANNIRDLLQADGSRDAVVFESVNELVQRAARDELNDRFFKTFSLGTGALRGRPIG